MALKEERKLLSKILTVDNLIFQQQAAHFAFQLHSHAYIYIQF